MVYNGITNICSYGAFEVTIYMKVIERQIEVVAWFNKEGVALPVRFKMTAEDESDIVVKIDKLLKIDKEKLASNIMLRYTCQSTIKGIQSCSEAEWL